MGMTIGYAGNLHTVKGMIVCIAKKMHGAQTPGMTQAIHKAEVGRRLRIAIEALGLSQAEVCRTMNVSPSKMGNWLRGDHYPDEWFIKRFCDRHGITTDWIYRGVVSGVASPVGDALWQAEQALTEES